MDLCGVDRITHIVALSVCYVCDKAFGFSEFLADKLNDIDVSHFVMTAYIVYFSDSSVVDHEVDCLTVVFYVKPVSDIQSFTVYGKGLVMKRVDDHQRYKLLREMIRSVVI